MGVGVIVVVASVALAAAAAAYAILSQPKGKKDQMPPTGLDQFGVTQATEGMAVPIIYGRVRTPGNIIWYGNLKTIELFVKPKGGKGVKPKKQFAGYQYYLDCWQAISYGKVSLISVLVNDESKDVDSISTTWNDGTMGTYPGFVTYANKISGIAHIAYHSWNLGESPSIPTLHFVVERVLEHPLLPSQNLATGSNPAAVIYDLLKLVGISDAEINLASFISASTYWAAQGLGLNFKIDSIENVGRIIEGIVNDVEAVFYKDNENRYAIRPLDPSDSSVATITESEISDFSFNRKTWSQVPNWFVGNFIDGAANFEQRAIRVYNPAAIRLAGGKIEQTMDMKRFRDIETVSRRLFELAKRNSYPAATIQGKVSLKYSTLLPGDVITLEYPSYGITSADYRITEIDVASVDKNEIAFEAVQQVETLFDDVYETAGGSLWTDPDLALDPLTYIRVFELPYTKSYGFDPTFLILAARDKLIETGCMLYTSASATSDFSQLKTELSTFAQRGTLDQEYGETRDIDDETGIYFTAYKDDPEFDTISRTELFVFPRLAVIDDELIAFEQVISLGSNQFQLLGCIRGVLSTPKQTHSAGAVIWLANIGNNVIPGTGLEDFYLKVVPGFIADYIDPADVTAIAVQTTYKARQPRIPTWITATRSGSLVSVQIYPTTPGVRGAGDSTPSETDSALPFPIGDSDFEVQIDSGTPYFEDSATFSITQAGAFTLKVRSRLNGYLSDQKTVSVGAGDGFYQS